MKRILIIGLFWLVATGQAGAGIYTDDLAKCLVSSTSGDDRNVLVRWMFSSMSLHPQVQSMVKITPAEREEMNKFFALLSQKLLTETCRAPAVDAVKYEGPQAVEASFAVLGQVAARELFSNPEVVKGMAGMQKYIDPKKFEAAGFPAAAEPAKPAQ